MKGTALRTQRKALQMTQVELAHALGVTGNTIARWERNEVKMPEPAARLVMLIQPKKRTR
ncbi:MAG: helix-turn-helix domain-containing protein [Nitrospira sp.]|nr:helix-turn-helix domain-containing protein [Nitrospira sp.]